MTLLWARRAGLMLFLTVAVSCLWRPTEVAAFQDAGAVEVVAPDAGPEDASAIDEPRSAEAEPAVDSRPVRFRRPGHVREGRGQAL